MAKKKDIGYFDTEVVINTISTTPNNSGGRTVASITATRTVWGSIKQMTPKNLRDLGQDITVEGYEIEVRKELDLNITRQNTVTFNSKICNVLAVYDSKLSKFYQTIIAYIKK